MMVMMVVMMMIYTERQCQASCTTGSLGQRALPLQRESFGNEIVLSAIPSPREGERLSSAKQICREGKAMTPSATMNVFAIESFDDPLTLG